MLRYILLCSRTRFFSQFVNYDHVRRSEGLWGFGEGPNRIPFHLFWKSSERMSVAIEVCGLRAEGSGLECWRKGAELFCQRKSARTTSWRQVLKLNVTAKSRGMPCEAASQGVSLRARRRLTRSLREWRRHLEALSWCPPLWRENGVRWWWDNLLSLSEAPAFHMCPYVCRLFICHIKVALKAFSQIQRFQFTCSCVYG